MIDGNIYYDPDKFGLKVVAVIELEDEPYSFDTLVVWEEISTGRHWWARDSGCSCPTPFENYHSVLELNAFDLPEVRNIVLLEMTNQNITAEVTALFFDALQNAGIR